MLGELITVPLRLLGRSSEHSIHSISGFAWGVAVVIALSGIITGFSTMIYDLTEESAVGNQFSIRSSDSSQQISNDIIEKLNLDDFELVLPLAKTWANFTTNERLVQIEIVGANLSTLLSLYPTANIIEGSMPIINQTPFECLQGAELRGYSELGLNYTLLDENRSGNCELVGTIIGVAELQRNIIVHLEDYEAIVGSLLTETGFNEVKVILKESMLLSELQNKLSDILKDNYDEIVVWKEKQADSYVNIIFKEIIDKLNLIYMVLFLLVMIRLYHNITWFTINHERTFLILRAVGLSKERLFLMILILGLLVGNIGFATGVLIGIILPSVILSLLTAVFSLEFIVVINSIIAIVQLWGICMVIMITATIIPSWKISKTPPSRISILIKER